MDRLLEEGRSTFDQEKRKQIYFRIQEIFAEETPIIFLTNAMSLPAMKKKIHGVVPDRATGKIGFDSAIHWFIPEEYRKDVTRTDQDGETPVHDAEYKDIQIQRAGLDFGIVIIIDALARGWKGMSGKKDKAKKPQVKEPASAPEVDMDKNRPFNKRHEYM